MAKQFNIGDERLNANGETLRLCQTNSGALQWRRVGENGEVIKRGRKAGSTLLVEMSLHQLLQHLGGRKFAAAVKAAAKEAGADEAFSAKIPVSSKWGEADVRETPSRPAKAGKPVGTSEVL